MFDFCLHFSLETWYTVLGTTNLFELWLQHIPNSAEENKVASPTYLVVTLSKGLNILIINISENNEEPCYYILICHRIKEYQVGREPQGSTDPTFLGKNASLDQMTQHPCPTES